VTRKEGTTTRRCASVEFSIREKKQPAAGDRGPRFLGERGANLDARQNSSVRIGAGNRSNTSNSASRRPLLGLDATTR
jgi:hypothetical protein